MLLLGVAALAGRQIGPRNLAKYGWATYVVARLGNAIDPIFVLRFEYIKAKAAVARAKPTH
jgi:hypothetical protein